MLQQHLLLSFLFHRAITNFYCKNNEIGKKLKKSRQNVNSSVGVVPVTLESRPSLPWQNYKYYTAQMRKILRQKRKKDKKTLRKFYKLTGVIQLLSNFSTLGSSLSGKTPRDRKSAMISCLVLDDSLNKYILVSRKYTTPI